MATTSDKFGSTFLLAPSNLRRIEEVLQKYGQISPLQISYQVAHKSKKVLEPPTLDELLLLDNTVKDPIRFLTISVSSQAGKPSFQTVISYPGERGSVELNISSSDAKLANQAQVELKEQVERTRLKSWMYGWSSVPLILLLVFIFFRSFAFSAATTPILNNEDFSVLSTAAKNAKTTDQKIDFIFFVY